MRHRLHLLALLLLSACGGGGGGGGGGDASPPSPQPTVLEGVVSVGAPLPGARVQLADAQGRLLGSSSSQAADGRYRLSLDAGIAPSLPLLLQAQGLDAAGRPVLLHTLLGSLSLGSTRTAHITPLTNASALLALGEDPAPQFARSGGSALLAATPATVGDAADAFVKTLLKTPLADLKIANADSLNLQTDAGFSSAKSPADLLLEALRIHRSGGELQLGSKFLASPAPELQVDLASARSELLKGSAGLPANAIRSSLKETSKAATVLTNAAQLDGIAASLNPLLAQGAGATALLASSALAGYERHDGQTAAQLAARLADWGARGLQLGPLQILGCADDTPRAGDCQRVEVASNLIDRSGTVQDRLLDVASYATVPRQWRLLGNGRPLAFQLRASSWLDLDAAGSPRTAPQAGIELRLQGRDATGALLTASATVQTPLGFALPLADCGDPNWLCVAGAGGAPNARLGSPLDRLLLSGQLGWLGGADGLRGARHSARFQLAGSDTNLRAFLPAAANAPAEARHPRADGVSSSAPLTLTQLQAGLLLRWGSWATAQPDARLVEVQLLQRDGSRVSLNRIAVGGASELRLPSMPAAGSTAEHELWLLALDSEGRWLLSRYTVR